MTSKKNNTPANLVPFIGLQSPETDLRQTWTRPTLRRLEGYHAETGAITNVDGGTKS